MDDRRHTMHLYTFKDVDDLAKTLSYILQRQQAGLERHNAFKVAVSGGSIPNILAQALLDSEEWKRVDFTEWEIFFADECAVPLDHEDSNYKLLEIDLLD
ncbi:suppressor of los1-1 [Xylographa opegraphella]|nr:suppressor of los1-1 [Xylographa opegraphella]